MISICEEDGYYRTADGTPYAIVEEYFTDRATGRIHKYGLKTFLGPNVEAQLGNQFSSWVNAFEVGTLNLLSQAPVTQDDTATVALGARATLELLANDSDPENESLSIDGIVQPLHGRVFLNPDNSVEYIADFDYIGNDSLYYWATDGQGNYSVADVNITVIDDIIFANDFQQ